LGAAAQDAARPARGGWPHPLGPCRAGQQVCSGKKGGAQTGPNPTDRGKPGTKHSVLTDAEDTPLGLTLGPANRHDSKLAEATLDAVPPVSGGRRGRPRRRPKKLHADKAYRGRPVRQVLRKRGITPRIARPGIDSSKRLGRHRWVVERTLAWMARFRRLVVRYERRADIHLAFVTLAAALVCLNQITRFC
jgi:transposase